MRRKIRLWMGVVLALCLAALPSGTMASSEEPKTHDSNINVNFEENDGPTKPVDPENPGTETPGPGTGMDGPLSLDYVSELSFGDDLVISSTTQTYSTVTEKPYIQVTDNRGNTQGWKLYASVSNFTQPVEGEADDLHTLKGSEILLEGGSPKSVNTTITPPQMFSETLPTDNSTVLVIQAGGGEGTGTWVHRYYTTTNMSGVSTPGDIKLKVYGGTANVGKHDATITWTLGDAP